MIAQAQADIERGEVTALPLRTARMRYRLRESDAKRLRNALEASGHLMQASGQRWVAA